MNGGGLKRWLGRSMRWTEEEQQQLELHSKGETVHQSCLGWIVDPE